MTVLDQLKDILNYLLLTIGKPMSWNPYYTTLNQIDKTEEGGQTIMSADLDTDIHTDFFNSLFNNDGTIKDIWNESLKDLWQLIAESKTISENSPNLDGETAKPNGAIISHDINSEKITFNSKDNCYGDAGNSFEEDGKWVRPWYNNSGSSLNQYTYKITRGTDIVKKLISNFSHLNYTNPNHVYPYPKYGEGQIDFEILISYFRLLMPENTRRIVVEDLNRNFWVIGQCTSMICAYLFGDSSYFKNIFQKILSEIVQLWENILYLWILFALIQFKNKIKYHIEMIPLPNNSLEPYNKYDNFELDIDWNNFTKDCTDSDYIETIDEIKSRLTSFKNKYSDTSLILFPYVRSENYQKNYYGTMHLLGVYFYNAIRNEESFRPFLNLNYENKLVPTTIKASDFVNYLYAARETNSGYKYCCPFDNSLTIGTQNQKFYCALRPIVNINSVSYQYVNGRNRIVLNDITFNFYDGIKNIVSTGQDPVICNYSINKVEESTTCAPIILNFKRTIEKIENIQLTDTNPRPNHGYYLGELVSYAMIGQGVNCMIVNHVPYQTTGKLIKVANFLPKEFLSANHESDNDLIFEQVTNTKIDDQYIKTDYIYNLAIGGKVKANGEEINGVTRVEEIFRRPNTDLGVENTTKDSNECYLYIPIETKIENGFKFSYKRYDDLQNNPIENISPSMMKDIGIESIVQYIKNHIDSDDFEQNEMVYFMGSCGAFPWHNRKANDGQQFESYWTINIMTHIFRFVPEIFKNVLTPEQIAESTSIEIDGQEIGLLQVLGDLNFQETFTRFLNNNCSGYLNNISPYRSIIGKWRLPQLFPDNSIANILCIKEQISQTYYYLYVESSNCPQEIKDAYQIYLQSKDDTELINLLNLNFNIYRNSGCFISEQEAIYNAVQNPSGVWAIFDGYEDGTNPNYKNSNYNNIEYYKNNKTSLYKEVARVEFNYNPNAQENKFSFSNEQQRDFQKSDWRDDHIVHDDLNGVIIPFGAKLDDSYPNKNTIKLNNGFYYWDY